MDNKKSVSKNSVQKFKQGRKIVKAEDGWRLLNGRAVQRTVNNAYAARQAGDTKLTHRYIVNGKQYGSFDGGKTYYGLSEGGRPLSYKANQQLLRAVENGKRNYTASKKSIRNTVTPRFLSKYSNMSDVIGGANNIKTWQDKLKNYYAPNTYNPDSIWGDNTQAAYEKYLEDQTKQNIKFGASDMIADINDTSGLEKAKEVAPNYETTYFDPHAKELFDKVVLRNPGYNFNYNPYSSFTFNTPLTFNKPITFSKQGSKLLKKNSINKFKKGRNLVPNFR